MICLMVVSKNDDVLSKLNQKEMIYNEIIQARLALQERKSFTQTAPLP